MKENLPPMLEEIKAILAEFGFPSFTANGQEEKGWIVADGGSRTAG